MKTNAHPRTPRGFIRLISLMVLISLFGCSYDDSIEVLPLSVELEYEKTAFAEPETAAVRVELRDGNGQVFVDTARQDRTAHFVVTPGIYEASTASQYIDSTESVWWRYMFNGTRSLIIVSPDSTNTVKMTVRVSRKRIVKT